MKNQIELSSSLKLDKSTPIPLYYQLKQWIISQIQEGAWAIGKRIPPEMIMCEQLGISRPTVRQAINELVSEGFLVKESRIVTVAKPKLEGDFFRKLQSFNVEMREKGFVPTTNVLALEVVTNQEVNRKLGLKESDRCIYLARLRFADDEPIVYVETFLPYEKFGKLMHMDFEKISLYEAIEGEYEDQIAEVVRTVESVAADIKEAGLLQVKKNSPICFVKSIAKNQYDEVIEYSVARYRGDRSKFQIHITRN